MDNKEFGPIESLGFLAELDEDERLLIESWGVMIPISKGEVLFRQGEGQDTLYLVLSGTLEAEHTSDVSRIKVGQIQAGESIGEMSVLDPMPASATVRAITDGKVWRINREKFQAFLKEHPSSGVKILENISIQLARRMRVSGEKLLQSWEGRFGFDEDY